MIHTVIEVKNFLETGFRGLVFTLHPVTKSIKRVLFRGEYYLSLHSSSLALYAVQWDSAHFSLMAVAGATRS